ncbi:hypothetical protein FRC02_010343 [Tulasnella sp. 418]|nr:hypothetical protein FRC02_010343 [Tulasnella sp. 418]
MRHCPPSLAVLSFIASIAPGPAVASPILGFLYPPRSTADDDRQSASSSSSSNPRPPQRSQPKRRRRKRASPSTSENAYSLANKYSPDDNGSYTHECWQLHGHTNCPRDDTSSYTVDTSSTISPTATHSDPSTNTVYVSNFQLSNLPEGWQTQDRSPFYSKPTIIGLSVTLAVLITVTIVGCVIWRIRVSKTRKDIEELLEEKKRRLAEGRLVTDSEDDYEDEPPPGSTVRRRRNRNPDDGAATSIDAPTDGDPEPGQINGATQLSRKFQKAGKRWKEKARLVARRKKAGNLIYSSTSIIQPGQSVVAGESNGSTAALEDNNPHASISTTHDTTDLTDPRRLSTEVPPNSSIPSTLSSAPSSDPTTIATTVQQDVSSEAHAPPSSESTATPRADTSPPAPDSGLPPAYRRRGFVASSRQPPSRTGKERALDDSEEEVPDEYLSLAASRNRDVLPTRPSSHLIDEETRRSIVPFYLQSAQSPELDGIDEEDATIMRRAEITGHVATDDKAVLERLRTMGSMPSEPPLEPTNGEHLPTAPEWLSQSAQLEELQNQESASDSGPSSANHSSGIPRLPSPPPQLPSHYPSSSSSSQIPPLPSFPPTIVYASSSSQQSVELPYYVPNESGSRYPLEKGDTSWLLPSAPPATTNEGTSGAVSIPPSPAYRSSLELVPSAPPLPEEEVAPEIDLVPSAPPLEETADETLATTPDDMSQSDGSEDDEDPRLSLGVTLPRSSTLPLPRYEP